MSGNEKAPVACALSGDSLRGRIESNHALAREALIETRRHGSAITLIYRRTWSAEVKAMVEAERACCAFLTFTTEERGDTIQVEIVVPPHATEMADDVLAAFVAPRMATAPPAGSRGGIKSAAAITASGAIACGVCCAAPIVRPVLMTPIAVGLWWFRSRSASRR